MPGDRNRQGDFSRVSRTGRVYRTERAHRTDPALPQYTNINITTSAPDPLRPINEFEHPQAPQRLTNSYPDRGYTLVRVLILFFEYNDLNIKPETTQFKATCESLGYEVTVYEIKMKDSWEYLENELKELFPIRAEKTELRIIYYDGHGGINDDSSLTLASHTFSKSMQEMVNALPQSVRDQSDALQDIAEVNWRDIVNMVNAMECDTLAILDCCDAGAGATTTSLAEEDEQVIGYRKELIGACGWRAEARYHMTPTLCSVLRKWGIGEAAPQAVHYLLRRNTVGKIILPRLEAIIPPDERDIYESFNDKSLKGYNALILGGDTGIGRSAAITFSRSGADVTIFYRAYEADQAMPENPKNDAQAIVELAKEWGGKVRLCQFRRNRSGAISLDSLKSHGQADTKFEILVNNFGYKFEDDNGENIFSAEGYDSAARLTFLEGNEVVKAALPFMKPGSKIINTVSLEQSDGPFSKKEYETAARVVEYLTKYQATQGEYKGHTITAILPGVE
ncbi:hypothetical protein TWF751_004533 [Orbilia oligospora]|nr:hypothetical protein TWF751_004533 [Orbilia oligospora]KAF3153690.1 hypothetical protein TWF751_004533 [Orbilia oligospora]